MFNILDILSEEYAFIACFGILSWLSSLQFAKLYPHNVKYCKYVLYLHCLLCILGIYEVILSYFQPTQLHSIQTKHSSVQNNNYHVKLLYVLCIPSHLELFITNSIIFQWIKIYFSVGATEGWLVPFKWCTIILFTISFLCLLTGTILVTFPQYKHMIQLIFAPIMYTVGAYCIIMAISFITVAYCLMRRVLKTTILSGIRTDRSVCRRLLGSGIILCTAYLIQGVIIYIAVLDTPLHPIFTSNIRWFGCAFKVSIIMIMINTLLLYSKIIKQRLKTHWKKWAKSNKIWDLATTSRKKRHKRNRPTHIRADTEEIPFDPADIRLIRALSTVGPLTSLQLSQNYSTDTLMTENTTFRMHNVNFSNINHININRKATKVYDEPPINTLQALDRIDDVVASPTATNAYNSFDTAIMQFNAEGGETTRERKDTDATNENSNDEDYSDDTDLVVFETVDELFDEYVANTEQQEIEEELYEMDQFQSEEDVMDIMDDEELTSDTAPIVKTDGSDTEIEDENDDVLIEIEIPKYDTFTCEPEMEAESISHNESMVRVESDDDDENIVKAVNLLELPPNRSETAGEQTSPNSAQYQLGVGMSAETDSVKIDDLFQDESHAKLNAAGNNTNTSDRDEAILMELLENGLNSPSKGQSPKSNLNTPPQSEQAPEKKKNLITPPRNGAIFHFPMNPVSVSKSTVDPMEIPMSPIDELHSYGSPKPPGLIPERESLNVVKKNQKSCSAPQSPRNGANTMTTMNQYTKHKFQLEMQPQRSVKFMTEPLKPGMFKSKSMQTSTSHKENAYNLSIDDDDILVDTFIDRDHADSSSSSKLLQIQNKPQTRKKPAFKKWDNNKYNAPPLKPSMLFTTHGNLPNSTSDTDKLLDVRSGCSSFAEEDYIYKDTITPQSQRHIERISGSMKPILVTNKHRSARTIDIDYRRTKEYKNIVNDSELISGSGSNPRFWRHLKKKHAKQLNAKGLKNKFTFSFEKARYQAVLSREFTPITPCSSPRHTAKKSSVFNVESMPYIEPLASTQSHDRDKKHAYISRSPQSLQLQNAVTDPLANLAPILSPTEIKSTKSNNLELLHAHSSHTQNKPSATAPNSPQSNSLFHLSSISPSKSPMTPQPSSARKKPQHISAHRPLTPLVLSSKFKRKKNKAPNIVQNFSMDSPKIAHEINKLNNKRRKLERRASKKQVDTGAVAAKLKYWKANQLRNDPRMKALERRRKQRKKMNHGIRTLRANSNPLTLNPAQSDPYRTSSKTKKHKAAHVQNKSHRDVHIPKNKAKWMNVLRRFGSGQHKEHNVSKQQQELQVHRSYNAYIGMDNDANVSDSSDSPLVSSSSSGGEYSDTDEHKHGPYPPPQKPAKIRKQKSKSRNKRKHAKQSKQDTFIINGEILNQVRYNKAALAADVITDSDADNNDPDIYASNNNNNSHRSSLKAFTANKKANPIKYKKARTFSPRTPKQSQHNIMDIDAWQVRDVWNYIVALFPEMMCYEDNILKSKINGVDFVLMQSESELKNRFQIQYPPHIMILLTMTRTLLMSYEGNNQNVLNAKANHNEDNIHQMCL